ncbi:hypothetical protein PRO82_002265 [Candidatus Protochlamydia amoebophila]|nr:hypothetical protein [Candidatus Protochlamydia amoebophila]
MQAIFKTWGEKIAIRIIGTGEDVKNSFYQLHNVNLLNAFVNSDAILNFSISCKSSGGSGFS